MNAYEAHNKTVHNFGGVDWDGLGQVMARFEDEVKRYVERHEFGPINLTTFWQFHVGSEANPMRDNVVVKGPLATAFSAFLLLVHRAHYTVTPTGHPHTGQHFLASWLTPPKLFF